MAKSYVGILALFRTVMPGVTSIQLAKTGFLLSHVLEFLRCGSDICHRLGRQQSIAIDIIPTNLQRIRIWLGGISQNVLTWLHCGGSLAFNAGVVSSDKRTPVDLVGASVPANQVL